MLRKIRRFVAVAIIAATPLVSVMTPGIALAASCSWTGAGNGTSFTDGANWGAGCLGAGGVPGAGDVVTIDNVSGSMLFLTDDLSGVSLGGMVFTGTKQVQINIVSGQTFTGNITSTNTDTVPSSVYGPIVLGANVTTTNVNLLGSTDTVTLGGNSLTFTTNTDYSTIGIAQSIVGAGTLNIDASTNDVSLGGTNTYSGTTNIIDAMDISNSANDSSTMFGTSAIIVAANASLNIHALSSMTFSNSITLQQSSLNNAGQYSSQLYVSNESVGNTPVNVSLPNVTMLGNSLFTRINGPSQVLSVNLAGINANGFCVQYGDEKNVDAANWQNGPTACAVAGAATTATPAAPSAPDTGFALVSAHPGVTMAITVAATAVLLAAARFTRSNTARR